MILRILPKSNRHFSCFSRTLKIVFAQPSNFELLDDLVGIILDSCACFNRLLIPILLYVRIPKYMMYACVYVLCTFKKHSICTELNSKSAKTLKKMLQYVKFFKTSIKAICRSYWRSKMPSFVSEL